MRVSFRFLKSPQSRTDQAGSPLQLTDIQLVLTDYSLSVLRVISCVIRARTIRAWLIDGLSREIAKSIVA